ncbi:hypothetical protein [Duganella vulcania]|uniref:Uncharacterized protein n=1 Tax=Duganella vulcania TaxID=2692166 RepID=A0A845GJ11_9BURK|nr:hypothetical protein [Duganella vulcania]MYM92737.1 hypothetical protein [Duganella vulcania]
MQVKHLNVPILLVESADDAVKLCMEAQSSRGMPVRQFFFLDLGGSVFDVSCDGGALSIEGVVVNTELDVAAKAGKLFTRIVN